VSAREIALRAIETRERRDIARALSLIEEGRYSEFSDILFGEPRAHVVGITGSPGVGKSSLINKLVQLLRKRGKTVAVIAIDPASPISGAALMGDRLRVRALDEGTFFRSISTPPEKALPLHAVLMVEFLDRAGFDYILIETPGVGQVNVDVCRIAHTTVVVIQPAAGDEIQALKSGIMEVGDIYVVNKADMPHAEVTALQLETIFRDAMRGKWKVRIIKTCTFSGQGVDTLVELLEERLSLLKKTSEFRSRVEERRWFIAERIMMDELSERIMAFLSRSRRSLSISGANPIELGRRLLQGFVAELCRE